MHALLGPSPDNAHAEGTQENQNAGVHSLSSTKDTPALITEKILRHKLDQRGKNQKSRRHSIHATDDQQADLRVGTV
jgi:hypothetical protein